VKAAIEAHISRMPRRFSVIGNARVLHLPRMGNSQRAEGKVSSVDRFSGSLDSRG
jgi:hypothetical protein